MQLNEFIGVTALFFSLANPVGVIPIFLKLIESHEAVHPGRIITVALATVGFLLCLSVALGAEMPDGGGVLDQEGEAVGIEQREHAGGVGADGIAHAGVEAIVDMGEDEIEMRTGFTKFSNLRHPFLLHAACELCAKIEKCAQGTGIFAGAEQLERIESLRLAKSGADIVIHGSEPGRVACAFERFKVELGQIHTIPIEAVDQSADAGGYCAEAGAIR